MDDKIEKEINQINNDVAKEKTTIQTNDESKNNVFLALEQIKNRMNIFYWLNLAFVVINFASIVIFGIETLISYYLLNCMINWKIVLPAVIQTSLSILVSCLINWYLINPTLKDCEQKNNKTKK